MKRYIRVLLLLCICFTFSRVNAEMLGEGFAGIPKTEMQTLSMKKVLEVTKVPNYTSIQGMTVTDKYLIVAARGATEEDKGALYVYDKNTLQLANLGSISNPVTGIDLEQANDLTYNPKTKKLVVVGVDNIVRILNPETFVIENTKTVPTTISSIAYDSVNDVYYSSHAYDGLIFDSNFNLSEQKYNIATNLTPQAMAYYDGKIYRSAYEAGSATTYQETYDGILQAKENLIYVTDSTGKLYNTYYIPVTGSFAGGEIESVTFIDGMMYILLDCVDRAEVYTPVYESASVPLDITIESQTLDLSKLTNTASLYDKDNKLIETKSLVNGKFTFTNLAFDSAGEYKYKIAIDINGVKASESIINVTISTKYDPVHNTLDYNMTHNDFINLEKGNTNNNGSNNGNNNANNNGNIENPKTGNRALIVLIVIILFSLLAVYIIDRKSTIRKTLD